MMYFMFNIWATGRKNRNYILIFYAALICLFSVRISYASNNPVIKFLGAAQSIGGSSIFIDTGRTKFLIDYGLYFENRNDNLQVFDDARKLDFVLLTHAHIDHSGRLPMLYRHGFKGPVFGTDATLDITGRMLDMSLGISETQDKAIFSRSDLHKFLSSCKTVGYGQTVELAPDVKVRFSDAGHILGSAIIEIWITRGANSMKIVATGDIGYGSNPILKNITQIYDADYVIVESTYGDTSSGNKNYDDFQKDIADTLKKGGSVLIPAFVLEKTQKVIAVLCDMKKKGVIPENIPVYYDSSSAHDITEIYRGYSKYYNDEAKGRAARGDHPLKCRNLQKVTGKEALKKHDSRKPAVFISSSGMLDHANSPKHFNSMVSDKKNLLAIVGWQAPGSPGRQLLEGAKVIKIPLEYYSNGGVETHYVTKPVNIRVKRYSSFSSHADGCEILSWLTGFKSVGKVFVIHGEQDVTKSLAGRISKYLQIDSYSPENGYKETLSYSLTGKIPVNHPDKCRGMSQSSKSEASADQ